jgi:hypothetical protein
MPHAAWHAKRILIFRHWDSRLLNGEVPGLWDHNLQYGVLEPFNH